ncbi:MAG: adenylate/guanylate cyclase domain-containing protein [Pseudomonadota bacterium]
MERKLTAILAADVVGYSRLMGADEAGTLQALKDVRAELVEPAIAEHKGRVVKLMGDGLLAEFASVVEAVSCAVAIQAGMAERNDGSSSAREFQLRIGVNLGDVIVDGADIYGDGVNVAARLEGLAEPGGICVADTVYQNVRGKLDVSFEDMGRQQVKNIAEPIHVYGLRLVTEPAPAASALPLPDKPSVAVLPLANLSNDPEQAYFSDGITEDIITELSRFRSLFVIARNSSFTFKDRQVKAQDVGRELGVAHLVQGSIRRSGDRVRVSVQLVKAASEEHVWAERYDRQLADIFAVQDELTQMVATKIGGRLQAEDRHRAVQSRTGNPTAYDCVLRAQSLYYEISRTANAEARPILEEAIRLDPNYARAHVVLAAIHNMDFMQSWSDDPERSLAMAIEIGQKAFALDESDGLVHAQLGEILQNARRFAEAGRHFERALDLNPNDVETRALYGSFIGGESGLEQLEIAERLDPCSFVWIPWIKGSMLFTARRYDDAIATLTQIDSRVTTAKGWLAASLAYAGRTDEARATVAAYLKAVERDLTVVPTSSDQWQAVWRREAKLEHEDDNQHLFEGLRLAGLDL